MHQEDCSQSLKHRQSESERRMNPRKETLSHFPGMYVTFVTHRVLCLVLGSVLYAGDGDAAPAGLMITTCANHAGESCDFYHLQSRILKNHLKYLLMNP